MPTGVGALYHSDTDTFDLPPLIGRADEGLVLHECMHAFYDITLNPIDALHDEASAYVVDALYYRMTGLQRPRWNNAPHPLAGIVADGLLQDYQQGNVPVPSVNNTAWTNLMTVIPTITIYASGPAGTGGSYLRNGVLLR
jgi:hypothetical protein